MGDDEMRRVLLDTRRVAVVGASDEPARPSHGVTAFPVARGHEVVPVNPPLAGRAIHGRPVVAPLARAGPLGVEPRGSPDMVDVFRRSTEAGAVVREAIRPGARGLAATGRDGRGGHGRGTAEARAAGLRSWWTAARRSSGRACACPGVCRLGRGRGNIPLEAEQEPGQLGRAMPPYGELT